MEDMSWLKHLSPIWLAWREKQLGKGRDPDPYIKQKLREDGLIPPESQQDHTNKGR